MAASRFPAALWTPTTVSQPTSHPQMNSQPHVTYMTPGVHMNGGTQETGSNLHQTGVPLYYPPHHRNVLPAGYTSPPASGYASPPPQGPYTGPPVQGSYPNAHMQSTYANPTAPLPHAQPARLYMPGTALQLGSSAGSSWPYQAAPMTHPSQPHHPHQFQLRQQNWTAKGTISGVPTRTHISHATPITQSTLRPSGPLNRLDPGSRYVVPCLTPASTAAAYAQASVRMARPMPAPVPQVSQRRPPQIPSPRGNAFPRLPSTSDKGETNGLQSVQPEPLAPYDELNILINNAQSETQAQNGHAPADAEGKSSIYSIAKQNSIEQFVALLRKYGPQEPSSERVLNLFLALTTMERKVIMRAGSIKAFLKDERIVNLMGNTMTLCHTLPDQYAPEVTIEEESDETSGDEIDEQQLLFEQKASSHGIHITSPPPAAPHTYRVEKDVEQTGYDPFSTELGTYSAEHGFYGGENVNSGWAEDVYTEGNKEFLQNHSEQNDAIVEWSAEDGQLLDDALDDEDEFVDTRQHLLNSDPRDDPATNYEANHFKGGELIEEKDEDEFEDEDDVEEEAAEQQQQVRCEQVNNTIQRLQREIVFHNSLNQLANQLVGKALTQALNLMRLDASNVKSAVDHRETAEAPIVACIKETATNINDSSTNEVICVSPIPSLSRSPPVCTTAVSKFSLNPSLPSFVPKMVMNATTTASSAESALSPRAKVFTPTFTPQDSGTSGTGVDAPSSTVVPTSSTVPSCSIGLNLTAQVFTPSPKSPLASGIVAVTPTNLVVITSPEVQPHHVDTSPVQRIVNKVSTIEHARQDAQTVLTTLSRGDKSVGTIRMKRRHVGLQVRVAATSEAAVNTTELFKSTPKMTDQAVNTEKTHTRNRRLQVGHPKIRVQYRDAETSTDRTLKEEDDLIETIDSLQYDEMVARAMSAEETLVVMQAEMYSAEARHILQQIEAAFLSLAVNEQRSAVPQYASLRENINEQVSRLKDVAMQNAAAVREGAWLNTLPQLAWKPPDIPDTLCKPRHPQPIEEQECFSNGCDIENQAPQIKPEQSIMPRRKRKSPTISTSDKERVDKLKMRREEIAQRHIQKLNLEQCHQLLGELCRMNSALIVNVLEKTQATGPTPLPDPVNSPEPSVAEQLCCGCQQLNSHSTLPNAFPVDTFESGSDSAPSTRGPSPMPLTGAVQQRVSMSRSRIVSMDSDHSDTVRPPGFIEAKSQEPAHVKPPSPEVDVVSAQSQLQTLDPPQMADLAPLLSQMMMSLAQMNPMLAMQPQLLQATAMQHLMSMQRAGMVPGIPGVLQQSITPIPSASTAMSNPMMSNPMSNSIMSNPIMSNPMMTPAMMMQNQMLGQMGNTSTMGGMAGTSGINSVNSVNSVIATTATATGRMVKGPSAAPSSAASSSKASTTNFPPPPGRVKGSDTNQQSGASPPPAASVMSTDVPPTKTQKTSAPPRALSAEKTMLLPQKSLANNVAEASSKIIKTQATVQPNAVTVSVTAKDPTIGKSAPTWRVMPIPTETMSSSKAAPHKELPTQSSLKKYTSDPPKPTGRVSRPDNTASDIQCLDEDWGDTIDYEAPLFVLDTSNKGKNVFLSSGNGPATATSSSHINVQPSKLQSVASTPKTQSASKVQPPPTTQLPPSLVPKSATPTSSAPLVVPQAVPMQTPWPSLGSTSSIDKARQRKPLPIVRSSIQSVPVNQGSVVKTSLSAVVAGNGSAKPGVTTKPVSSEASKPLLESTSKKISTTKGPRANELDEISLFTDGRNDCGDNATIAGLSAFSTEDLYPELANDENWQESNKAKKKRKIKTLSGDDKEDSNFDKLMATTMSKFPHLTRVECKAQLTRDYHQNERPPEQAGKMRHNYGQTAPEAKMGGSLLYKTQICGYWKSGMCVSGDQCVYAHGKAELRAPPKHIMCSNWKKNRSCKHGENCIFAHGEKELAQATAGLAPKQKKDGVKKSAGTTGSKASWASVFKAPDTSTKNKYTSLNDNDEDDANDRRPVCVICCDRVSEAWSKTLECGHVFHSNCILRWIEGEERTCPTCRSHALLVEDYPLLG